MACRDTLLTTKAILLTEVSKMAARNNAFVKPCFELLRKKSSYPLISEGRRICQLNLLTLRPSRGFFIDGYNPLILAYTSRRVSTICQPRRFCYLLPVNGFKSSPSSTVLQLCLHLAGGGYTLLFSLHFCLPYLHSILGSKIPDFGTYIATLDTSHKSSGYFSLSDIP